MIKKCMVLLIALLIMSACGTSSSNSSNSFGSSAAKGDEVSVTEAYVKKWSGMSDYYFKVKNNYGKYVPYIRVTYQLINKEGDALDSTYLTVKDLDDGQGVFNNIQFSDSNMPEDLYAIKFTSFVIEKALDDGSYTPECEGRFTEPYIFVIEDIPEKK